MIGREKKKYNDIFFVCSLIEYIGRRTKNHRNVIVNALGKDKLQHLYKLADVYHSENMEKVSDELIRDHQIQEGVFDNVAEGKYLIPSYWDIGKVYKRLIIDICEKQNKKPIETLIEVYNSWLSRKIEDFNSSLYYENPDYLYESYIKGDVYQISLYPFSLDTNSSKRNYAVQQHFNVVCKIYFVVKSGTSTFATENKCTLTQLTYNSRFVGVPT